MAIRCPRIRQISSAVRILGVVCSIIKNDDRCIGHPVVKNMDYCVSANGQRLTSADQFLVCEVVGLGGPIL